MDIEKIKITDIKPAEYNPRNISSEELTKLTNSINEFGLVDPIIINLKNNKIIGGHQRYEVLINQHMLNNDFYGELNLIRMGDIGWIFTETDLTVEDEDHEKALNLALNKISGEWDFEKLTELLDELDLNGFDISLSGFDGLDDLDFDLDGDYNPDEGEYEIEEDEYEEPDDLEVTVKYGDLFRLGSHYLLCGDSTLEADVEKLLSASGERESIDMVFTDPPYGNGESGRYGRGQLGIRTILGDNDLSVFNNFIKIIPCDKIIYFLQWRTLCESLHTISQAKLKLNTVGVWDKRQAGLNASGGIAEQWEAIIFAGNIKYSKFGGNVFNISRINTKRENLPHPHQKPLQLLNQILSFIDNVNTILDPFAGSGSILMLCEELNKECYSMELDPYYCQVIINRWEEFTGEKAEKIEG